MLPLSLTLTLAANVPPSPVAVEPFPHLSEVLVRQDGPDVGEYLRFEQVYPGTPGPMIAAVDGNGVLVGFWDFSATPVSDWEVVVGGPAVAGRDFDLAAGVGPGVTGPDDFLPDGTQTIYWLRGGPAYGAYVLGLVGTNVDPDGDGRTLLMGPSAPPFAAPQTIALVDGTWPQQSSVFDCAPIVGPDGTSAPAGAFASVSGAHLVCRDAWLLPDGTRTGPCGFYGFSGSTTLIECGQALLGTPYCSGTPGGFLRQTRAWGSPLLGAGTLYLLEPYATTSVHLVSAGRGQAWLPGIPEPLCVAAPYVRVPGTTELLPYSSAGNRLRVDLGLIASSVPVLAGCPLCIQTWTRSSSAGGAEMHLAEPIAIVLR